MSSLENQLRVLKRSTNYRFKFDEFDGPLEEDEAYYYRDSLRVFDRKASEKFLSAVIQVGHVPMGKELKRIRQLMASKHMTEQEVRNHPTYKIELSQINKDSKAKLNEFEKKFVKICRRTMKELGLPIWNETVARAVHTQCKNEYIHVPLKRTEIPQYYLSVIHKLKQK